MKLTWFGAGKARHTEERAPPAGDPSTKAQPLPGAGSDAFSSEPAIAPASKASVGGASTTPTERAVDPATDAQRLDAEIAYLEGVPEEKLRGTAKSLKERCRALFSALARGIDDAPFVGKLALRPLLRTAIGERQPLKKLGKLAAAQALLGTFVWAHAAQAQSGIAALTAVLASPSAPSLLGFAAIGLFTAYTAANILVLGRQVILSAKTINATVETLKGYKKAMAAKVRHPRSHRAPTFTKKETMTAIAVTWGAQLAFMYLSSMLPMRPPL